MDVALIARMTNPKADELKARTKRFALEILSFRRHLTRHGRSRRHRTPVVTVRNRSCGELPLRVQVALGR